MALTDSLLGMGQTNKTDKFWEKFQIGTFSFDTKRAIIKSVNFLRLIDNVDNFWQFLQRLTICETQLPAE